MMIVFSFLSWRGAEGTSEPGTSGFSAMCFFFANGQLPFMKAASAIVDAG
jgi:hypothetical protein